MAVNTKYLHIYEPLFNVIASAVWGILLSSWHNGHGPFIVGHEV